jgi:hypothetical protein
VCEWHRRLSVAVDHLDRARARARVCVCVCVCVCVRACVCTPCQAASVWLKRGPEAATSVAVMVACRSASFRCRQRRHVVPVYTAYIGLVRCRRHATIRRSGSRSFDNEIYVADARCRKLGDGRRHSSADDAPAVWRRFAPVAGGGCGSGYGGGQFYLFARSGLRRPLIITGVRPSPSVHRTAAVL